LSFPGFAIVNPHRADATYPDSRLAGSGVAFTLARLTRGPDAARRYLAPDAAPLVAQLPAKATQTAADARRVVATGVSLECGQLPILQSGSRNERCVRYGDGSRVFLWRHDGRWLVVGFTLR